MDMTQLPFITLEKGSLQDFASRKVLKNDSTFIHKDKLRNKKAIATIVNLHSANCKGK